jgi:hypothetical protein
MSHINFHTFCCRTFFFLIFLTCIFIPAGALTISQSDSTVSSSPSIANGDPVIIRGIATGHPQNGLQVWLIGYNYLKVSTISVNNDNSFEYELKKADTQNLAPGQYFVVVQHPMMNGQFDIIYNAGTGEITNRQLGSNGLAIFQMSGSGSLQSPAGAQALIQAINSQNIDDSFTTFSFVINPPSATISPIGDHYVGDKFTISGSTNLAAGDNLQVEITSSSFAPSKKTADSSFSGITKMVQVQPGASGKNQWSLPVDTASFRPDEYMVSVSGITMDVTSSTTFNLREYVVTATTNPIARITTQVSTVPTTPVPPTPAPTTMKSPMALWPLVSGITGAVIFLNRKKK